MICLKLGSNDGGFCGGQQMRDQCSLVCMALQKWVHRAALTD